MADTKISALPASTTPLSGTEVLPLVQSGVTKQVSVANLTAGRAISTAGGSFTDNFTQSTSGKGINFTANTPQAGMTSQLLNWYEEGTYSPTYQGSTSNPTVGFSDQYGYYTRVGNVVHFTIRLSVSSLSGGSGDLRVTLPFTTKNTSGGIAGGGSVAFSFQFNVANPVTIFVPNNAAYFTMKVTPSDLSDLQVLNLANPSYLSVSGYFFV
jgi:hypothetical protein